MAYSDTMVNRTMIAGGALATQFVFITGNASNQVAITGNGLRSDGVLITTATVAGQAVEVQYDGRANVLSGGTIATGVAVASDAAGKAKTAVTGNVILGYAEEAAVNNQIMTIRLARGETLMP
jgi:hypothetical protein